MNSHGFMAAIKAGEVETVAEFLDQDPSLPELRDEAGATPLHYAALNGHREIARLLISRGADVNCLDTRFGATPAGWAIEYLRELGGVLAIEIDDLVYAIEQRDVRWTARILERFPRLKTQVDSTGKPIREHAENCGDAHILELFVAETGRE